MKTSVLLVFVGGLILAEAGRTAREEKYTTRFDNVNVDAILGNHRLLESYYKCVMGTGKCTPDGEELKSHLSDALQTNCAKCSDAQKEGAKKIIRHFYNNEPEWWKELEGKYDPTGSYLKKNEDLLKTIVA